MSWKSWLLPNRASTSSISSPQVLGEQHIRAAKQDASALMEAIGALALPIIAGSWQCTQAVTPYLRPNQERFTREPLTQQSCILNEFLYFFIHLMKRHANDQLSGENSKKLQAIVLPLVIRSAAVDSFFGHWPQEYRSGIERDFYKVLDDVEKKYTTRTVQLVARGDTYAGPIPPQFANLRVELALSSRLALSVLDLAGYEVEEGRPVHERDFSFASMVGGEAMKVLSVGDLRNFRELVANASREITVYESSTQRPLIEFNGQVLGAGATPCHKRLIFTVMAFRASFLALPFDFGDIRCLAESLTAPVKTGGRASCFDDVWSGVMSRSQLPLWVQYGQALGPPLLAGVIGIVGAWIALQQMHLARIKLQHDTYDRKYAVFEAVSWVLLGVAALKRAPSLEDMRNFLRVIGAAPFLFDAKLVAYLKEIERRVHRANGLNDMMSHFSDDDKPQASKELEEHIVWLSEQHNVIIEKFRPSLELRKQCLRVWSWVPAHLIQHSSGKLLSLLSLGTVDKRHKPHPRN